MSTAKISPMTIQKTSRRAAALIGAIAVTLAVSVTPTSAGAAPTASGGDDVTVIAVIDQGLVPYHWDFLASKMPQAETADTSDDLPLARPPHEWLRGFPSPHAFASYERLDLSLEQSDPRRPIGELMAADAAAWEEVKPSSTDEFNYLWIPNTKVIGAIDFAGTKIRGQRTSHGVGTTSVSVGNLHGTCPECLLVFLSFSSRATGEAAIEWAMDQPWIDAITNSYGFSLAYRDRVYSGSDVKAQRRASHRGQTIFFSAGNGQDGAFVVPNTTYFSSQEGPDWIVTVGAISPGDGNYYGDPTAEPFPGTSYSGHGKPADIASVGGDYPSAYGATEVGETGPSGFGGTSNATPTVAGMYGRSLYVVRRALQGPSRIQDDGVIASGDPLTCGAKRPRCEVGDGILTAPELRTRLFHGAVHTPAGMSVAGYGGLPPLGEDEFLNEGHGSYAAREAGPADPSTWLAEMRRIVAPMFGEARSPARPEGEKEWMIVDSFCRQRIWGTWRHGYYLDGTTALPGNDSRYPTRSAMERACAYFVPPP